MLKNTLTGLAVTSSAAILLLAGCGGGTASSPGSSTMLPSGGVRQPIAQFVDPMHLGLPAGYKVPVQSSSVMRSGWLSPDATKTGAKVFVSDVSANAVVIYKASTAGGTAPIGSITTGINQPVGQFVNSIGTLFVANLGAGITEYKKGSKTPSKTLTSTEPVDVAEAADGTVYASEFINNKIDVYAKGATSPTSELTGINGPEGLSIDTKGNLFASYFNVNSSSGGVIEYKAGSKTGKDLGIVVSAAGDIKVDKGNNIALGDQNNHVVNIYPPGKTTPSRTIPTAGNPFKFDLNKLQTSIYIADTKSVEIYNYKTAAATGSYSSGLSSAYGVSVNPDTPY